MCVGQTYLPGFKIFFGCVCFVGSDFSDISPVAGDKERAFLAEQRTGRRPEARPRVFREAVTSLC